jgi:drug/metabolite transporter (DMT)-like permease
MSAAETKPPLSAFIAAFAAIYVIWGSTYLGIRITIETMPPFLMAAARFAIAGAILLLLMKLRGAAMPTPRQWRQNAIIGAFLLLGGNGLVAWAEQFVASGVTALIIGIQPVFMVLTEWAWPGGTRPGRAVWIGMMLGFVGVAWLAAPWEAAEAHGRLHAPGVIAILAACAFWAFGSIFSRHAKPAAPPLVAAAAQMLCGSVALGLVAAGTGEFGRVDVAGISGRSWIAFLYLVVIGSLVGFSTFVWLMKHSTPARVATYAYVNPIVAVFLGWLVLDEPISDRTLVGACLVVIAVVIVTTQKNKKTHTAPEPHLNGASPAAAGR